MAYAIIQVGGKQFNVCEGDIVKVPLLSEEAGAAVEFDVLAYGDADKVEVGTPLVDGTRAKATIIEHGRGPKVIVFKKKRRIQYKKKHGHRQDYTAVRIDSISAAN